MFEMTNKQMEEKREEFTKFLNDSAGMDIQEKKTQEVWQWISKLVEEVEDSLVQEFEGCISEELLINVEKFLDLKDEIESKWD